MKTNEQFLEALRVAKTMTPSEKVFSGCRLFDQYCEKVRPQLREQFPDSDDATILLLLRRHVAIYHDFENGLAPEPNQIPATEIDPKCADSFVLRLAPH